MYHASTRDMGRSQITEEDIELIREHTKTLFTSFWALLTDEQRKKLVNPLARKFAAFDTLNRTGL
jgi:hypothetical protein